VHPAGYEVRDIQERRLEDLDRLGHIEFTAFVSVRAAICRRKEVL
jgi:hypothetical protein